MVFPLSSLHLCRYTRCPHCLKWTTTNTLWRHFSVCLYTKLHPETPSLPVHHLVMSSQMIAGRYSEEASEEMKKEVFSIMKNDDVAKVAKRDDMIVTMGNATQ